MKHKKFEEWLQLSLYNELSEQEQVLLTHHLQACEQCQLELVKLKKIHESLSLRKSIAVSEPMLQEARRNLRLRIQADAEKITLWKKLKRRIDDFLAPPLQIAFGGAATLALGILVGYILFKMPSENNLHFRQTAYTTSAMEAGESQVTNIHFVDRDVQSGDVDFTFESVTPVHIRGNVNDEHIQKILARALVSNQNAGVRLLRLGRRKLFFLIIVD